MNGLMAKDLLTLEKKYGYIRIAIDVALTVIMIVAFKNTGAIMAMLLAPLEIMSIITTLADCDKQWKWDRYAIALPVSKKQIVASRYTFAALAVLVGFAEQLVIALIAYFAFATFALQFYLIIALLGLAMMLLFTAILLPTNYSLGANAGGVLMIILLVLAVVVGITIRVTRFNWMAVLSVNTGFIVIAAVLCIAALCVLSYILSVHFFQRKHS